MLITCYKTVTSRSPTHQHEPQAVHWNITFKATPENKEQIKLLDFLLLREEFSTEVDIYRKPTATDKTVNFFQNRPIEHKIAADR